MAVLLHFYLAPKYRCLFYTDYAQEIPAITHLFLNELLYMSTGQVRTEARLTSWECNSIQQAGTQGQISRIV
jgi:hypothetical protein